MRHIFIINPAAGKKDATAAYTHTIETLCRGMDYTILVSKAPGDCCRLAREEALRGEECRIYACGGDGTLNEVVNGVAGLENAAVTHFAGGSGNDFIRIFREPEAFFHLERLLDAQETRFDLIACGADFGLNICSVGLDARIGTDVVRYKRLPLVSGSGAYILSALVNVLRKLHEPYELELDGQVIRGELTMICVANGRFYGGGFNPVPRADPADGWLEVLTVAPVGLLTAARAVGKYKAGQYKKVPELIGHHRCKSITIRCGRPSPVNLDGELRIHREVTMSVCPKKLRFFYPRGLSWEPREESWRK